MIPHSRPWIVEADLDAVAAVLRSGLLASGSATARFGAALADWLGFPAPGVCTGSGTAALELALRAVGVGPGDEVAIPSYVCPSVALAVTSAGARPVLTDVGPEWVVTPACAAPHVGPRTRAIVVPHMYGVFADVAAFRAFGVAIIEDCAQAFARPGLVPLAGDVVVTSFHPTKCLTTGEGGYAIAKDPSLNRALRTLSDGGGSARPAFGLLPDLSAALGSSQLARYDDALARRSMIAGRYERALGTAAPLLRAATPADRTMHFRFVMHAPGGLPRAASFFAERGITVRRGVDQLLHRRAGLPDSGFATTCRHFDHAVSVPLHPSLSDDDADRCAEALAAWSSSLAG